MDDGERIFVPYSPAFAETVDRVIRPIVERVLARAKAAIADYISAEMPRAVAVKEWHEGGRRYCKVREPHKRSRVVVYDYDTKAVSVLEGVEA